MNPSYWPTAQQELCLRAALLPGEAGRAAWRQAVATTAIEDLDAASRSLVPLVYQNLARLGAFDDVAIESLKGRYLLAWGENQRAFDRVLPLLRAFEEAGIEHIVLKGLALIARFYRDPGVRPMADVDVLVRSADVERASDVAGNLGWRPRYRLSRAFLRVKHAGPLDHPAGFVCDVHWRVFEEAGASEADRDFWAAAEPAEFQGTRFRVLAPTDQLLHVCGHAARWQPVPAIRWVADAMVILREAPIDWPRFLAHTVERRFVLRMRQMLGYLRLALAATVPSLVAAELARRPVTLLERLEHLVRTREHRVLGELPTYVFNCLRGEPRPMLALPGYLRDAWGLASVGEVVPHALSLAARRVRTAIPLKRSGPGTGRSGADVPR
jgi:hypothetical protein